MAEWAIRRAVDVDVHVHVDSLSNDMLRMFDSGWHV